MPECQSKLYSNSTYFTFASYPHHFGQLKSFVLSASSFVLVLCGANETANTKITVVSVIAFDQYDHRCITFTEAKEPDYTWAPVIIIKGRLRWSFDNLGHLKILNRHPSHPKQCYTLSHIDII